MSSSSKCGNVNNNNKNRNIHRTIGDVLSILGLFLTFFCMAASNRVYGILLIELQARFPSASMKALNSLSGVVGSLHFIVGNYLE